VGVDNVKLMGFLSLLFFFFNFFLEMLECFMSCFFSFVVNVCLCIMFIACGLLFSLTWHRWRMKESVKKSVD
jgi:hypothetical protein